ncbi:hypothetical protein K502DRAFT_90721 [Neoconidiobolus thromboides FSU 785]|nr:hypothetical protein K502DRAFT_90721 [Neoconidiobolus thromboides FSU 785]
MILVGDYLKAAECFSELHTETNWSKAFYCYLQATCYLRVGEVTKASNLFIEAPTLIKKRIGGRTIPIEAFVKSRSHFYNERLNANSTSDLLLQSLPQLEVTYYFNGFHFMSQKQLGDLIEQLNSFNAPKPDQIIMDDEVNILSHMILGSIYRESNDWDLAQQHLSHLINLPGSNTFQSTTLSYSYFELAVLEFSNSPPGTPSEEPKKVKMNSYLQGVNQYLLHSELEERLAYRMEWLKEDILLVPSALSS